MSFLTIDDPLHAPNEATLSLPLCEDVIPREIIHVDATQHVDNPSFDSTLSFAPIALIAQSSIDRKDSEEIYLILPPPLGHQSMEDIEDDIRVVPKPVPPLRHSNRHNKGSLLVDLIATSNYWLNRFHPPC